VDARLSVRDGMLWLRPPGGEQGAPHIVRDAAGYIRTGDRVAIESGRARFIGREDTTLNVGGIKVQVEAVEEIVHAHPAVAQCRITAKPSAMMGNLLTLSVVPRAEVDIDPATLRQEIALWCKSRLPPPARPATIRIVQEIPVSSAGKTERAIKP
jgi:acyl-coenzyme A synthetase/AMP-(fatty) acid ligase